MFPRSRWRPTADKAGQRVQPVGGGELRAGEPSATSPHGRVGDAGACAGDCRAGDDPPQLSGQPDADRDPAATTSVPLHRVILGPNRRVTGPRPATGRACRARWEAGKAADDDGCAEAVTGADRGFHVGSGTDKLANRAIRCRSRRHWSAATRAGVGRQIDKRRGYPALGQHEQRAGRPRRSAAQSSAALPSPYGGLAERQQQADQGCGEQDRAGEIEPARRAMGRLSEEQPAAEQRHDAARHADPEQQVVIGVLADKSRQRHAERPADASIALTSATPDDARRAGSVTLMRLMPSETVANDSPSRRAR